MLATALNFVAALAGLMLRQALLPVPNGHDPTADRTGGCQRMALLVRLIVRSGGRTRSKKLLAPIPYRRAPCFHGRQRIT